MAFAFDDVNKLLFESVDPSAFPTLFIVSRTINPAALPDIAALKAANVPVDYWKVSAGHLLEMTAGEKLAQNNGFLIPALRAKRLARLIADTQAYLDSRYPPTIMTLLDGLLNDPGSSAARLTHIRQVFAWRTTILQTFNTARAALAAAATLVALAAVTYDFTPLTATDPGVTIQSALAL